MQLIGVKANRVAANMVDIAGAYKMRVTFFDQVPAMHIIAVPIQGWEFCLSKCIT
jgi:hypothetical protein